MLTIETQEIKLSHLLPVISAQPLDYLKGAVYLSAANIPWVIGLLLIYPLLSKPDKLKLISGGVLASHTLVLFINIFLMIGIFGSTGIQTYLWPVIEANCRESMPLLVLDQMGLLFLIVLFTMFLSGLSFIFYLIGSGLQQQFQKLDYRWCLGGVVLVAWIGTILIPNLIYDDQVIKIFRRFSLVNIYAYPQMPGCSFDQEGLALPFFGDKNNARGSPARLKLFSIPYYHSFSKKVYRFCLGS